LFHLRLAAIEMVFRCDFFYAVVVNRYVMKICLVEISLAYPKLGSLSAYNEVIESFLWGFHALGFSVVRRVNIHDAEARNIVFGYPYNWA
jgi:ABC-type uncharacterized transport system permease subunit